MTTPRPSPAASRPSTGSARSTTRSGLAETYDSLGYVHRHLGHQDEATACYEEAVSRFGELGNRYSEAETLVFLGDAHQAFGDPAAARGAWQRALTILEHLGHPGADRVRARATGRPATGVRRLLPLATCTREPAAPYAHRDREVTV